MRRIPAILAMLLVLLSVPVSTASAISQRLDVLSYKFYPLRDIAFVDLHNPYFAPIDNIIVNMVIREGTGRNRVLAIGQTVMPPNLVLRPGEQVGARVEIRARVVRDIPALAQFEFRIQGRQVEDDSLPPDVVVEGSSNGVTLEFNRDVNGVPIVVGFIGLSPSLAKEQEVQVQGAVVSFYDENRKIVWSELMPIGGRLRHHESLMAWAKYEHLSSALVPDISMVTARFLLTNGR